MNLIECKAVGAGLRADERTVTVADVRGFDLTLRVAENQLTNINGKTYLSVGVVGVDPAQKMALVELPHESDSGRNRLWAWQSAIQPAEAVP